MSHIEAPQAIRQFVTILDSPEDQLLLAQQILSTSIPSRGVAAQHDTPMPNISNSREITNDWNAHLFIMSISTIKTKV